jgi:ribosomal protein L28
MLEYEHKITNKRTGKYIQFVIDCKDLNGTKKSDVISHVMNFCDQKWNINKKSEWISMYLKDQLNVDISSDTIRKIICKDL